MGGGDIPLFEEESSSESYPDELGYVLSSGAHANAGGPHASESDGHSSSSDYEDTDKLIDHISALLKSCFRKNLSRRVAGRQPTKRQRTHRSDHCPDRKKPANRGNLSWYCDLVKAIPPKKKDIIKDYGFHCFLELDCSGVPRSFSQWIANHVQPSSSDIVLDSGVIHLSPMYVSHITGLPDKGLEVKLDSEGSKEAFLNFIGLSEMPTIKQLGEMLLKGNLSDEKFFVVFMAITLSSYLCPNSSTYPSTRYLGPLLVPKETRKYNWAAFTYMWMMEGFKKYLKDKSKSKVLSSKSNPTLGVCNYVPAVQYLDFVDLGKHTPPNSLPRITVWKNDMIRELSEFDLKHDDEYGLRKIKDKSRTCYAIKSDGASSSSALPMFRATFESSLGNSLPDNIFFHLSFSPDLVHVS